MSIPSLSPREEFLRGDASLSPPWRAPLAEAARLARRDRPESADPRRQTLWDTGADVTGPLFYGFVEWCLAEAARRGIEDLHFLSRGGQIFLRVAREIQAARPRPLRLHYLHTSRLAFIGAADAADPARLRELAAPGLAFHSCRQTLAILGLKEDPALAPGWLPVAEWERNLTQAERLRLADWLLAEPRLARVRAGLAGRAERARAYLHQQGLRGGAQTAVVDTGWMGTIQKNIEFLLGAPGSPAPLTGFYLGLQPIRDFHCAGPQLAYTNEFARLPLRRVTTHLILLELMARADHGYLLGFADDGAGAMIPQLAASAAETDAEIRFFQEAVLAFARHALAAGDPLAAAPPAEVARAVIGGYAEFERRSTRAEVLAFGRIKHIDQVLEQRESVLCPEMRTGEILAALVDWHRRPPCWWLNGQAVLGHAPLIHAYLMAKNAKWRLQTRLTGRTD